MWIGVSYCSITGAESVVYEAILDGKKVAVKKPILSTSEDIDKYHKELQMLWSLSLSLSPKCAGLGLCKKGCSLLFY